MENRAVEAAMRPVNYEIIFDVEDDHWWFVGRRAVVFAQIEDALGTQASQLAGFQSLDIGCGTGATMDHLRKYGEVQGIDLAMIPLSFSRRRGHLRTMCASATELPFADESFDLVTALDVIEHLEDDVKGLSEIRRVLKPGAPAVIYVPAFQALWGPNDDQSGHKRRYRLPQLQSAAERAGLKVERISYSNFAMFLPIWLGRKLLNLLGKTEASENRINHPFINNLLARLFAGEANWLRRHRLPFGVSVVCVVRKVN
ncbi:MAG TPA: class I SAM-dependent methyltransferase [Blastocatellia bacterium]|nr:class I SAM-dependent methyltransferase [Blastocatellia bacterium]HMV82001.1 class I SAM-dependent methyltransferase [Blastocatellia bacterium]HMY74660.1 class I SAM-dependent methyltransferase [Blastocatellia bacterium]HMZ20422.1 class I SAM-dependent methyltransferase [Blastocatellia bacterium]HNG28896.1 class I SAM-dependent methyltransferase [Blastocatellia bacterium]